MHLPLDVHAPSSRCTIPLCTKLKNLIRSAGHSVDFALYGIRQQQEILTQLVAAEARGVRVRGVVDKTVDGENYYDDTYLLDKHLRNVRYDYNADLKRQHKLKAYAYADKCQRPSGYDGPLQCFEGESYASKEKIRFSGDIMHNKFFIVDNHTVWTGSANISNTGTGGYNANIVALIHSPSLARYYKTEFEQMFVHGLYHNNKPTLRNQKVTIPIDGAEVSLFFSPQDKPMRHGLLPLIQEANNDIDIAIFFLTHNDVSKALAKAAERGVRVRIILDATGATNAYSKHEYLRNNNVNVKVESWGGKMHAKAALIDNQHLIVGSMNWTKAGDTKNDENTLIIQSKTAAQQFRAYYETLWASIPNQWLTANPRPESPESGGSCHDGIDNDWDDLVDNEDPDCANRIN